MNHEVFISCLNEGKQADAYKRKKMEELKKNDKDIINTDRRANRTGDMASYTHHLSAKGQEKGASLTAEERRAIRDKHLQDDEWDKNKPNSGSSNKSVRDEIWNRYNNGKPMTADEANRAKDAANRHKRRHPEAYKECGIFGEILFM